MSDHVSEPSCGESMFCGQSCDPTFQKQITDWATLRPSLFAICANARFTSLDTRSPIRSSLGDIPSRILKKGLPPGNPFQEGTALAVPVQARAVGQSGRTAKACQTTNFQAATITASEPETQSPGETRNYSRVAVLRLRGNFCWSPHLPELNFC